MRMLRRLFGVIGALAVFAATASPVTVQACPAAAQDCCCGQVPGEHDCCCPKPPGALPGSDCSIQKALPDAAAAAAGPALEPLGAGVLFAAPSATPQDSTPGVLFHARIEPGWDPGNQGFLLPLRL